MALMRQQDLCGGQRQETRSQQCQDGMKWESSEELHLILVEQSSEMESDGTLLSAFLVVPASVWRRVIPRCPL